MEFGLEPRRDVDLVDVNIRKLFTPSGITDNDLGELASIRLVPQMLKDVAP